MRPILPDEYRLLPIASPKPRGDSEMPAPLPVDIRSGGPLPMVPLPQLPVLDRKADSTSSRTGPSSYRSDASYRLALEARQDEKNQRSIDRDYDPEQEIEELGGAAWRIDTSDGPVWIEGDTILCACPDCGAPMSVRLWLMLAQCWRCETQIELSEEQQRAIEQLLAQREQVERNDEPSAAPVAQAPAASGTTAPESATAHRAASAFDEPTSPSPQSRDAAASSTVRLRVNERRRATRFTPAWLISLVLHFILLLLLALLAITDYVDMESITLSSFVSTADQEGGFKLDEMDPSKEVQFELPLPADADLSDRDQLEEYEEANQDAAEIREDDNPAVELADMELVREQLTREVSDRSHFVARDPRFRVEMVRQEGGTTLTEAAVARGLSWLARYQNQDGSWSLKNYEDSDRASNRGDAAATSLALLPFLGAGQTHEYGRYKETVAKGLLWLLEHQDRDGDELDGDLRAGMTDQLGMYAHGQAAIVLVEALALSGDERFRDPAQRAINFIVEAQHDEGGWRYRPGQEGDTSVLGWQLMALQSARSPGLGLEVPETTLQLAEYYLDLASENEGEGALYGYQPSQRHRPTETMTAEALLCRMYLGWQRDDPRVMAGMQWVADRKRPSTRDKNIYYWYYATQAFHNYGGNLWEEWNEEMSDVLVRLQTSSGRHAGSWSPNGFQYGDAGDRIYVTALAICTLEVYYRHLPIFRQIEVEP